MEFKTFDGTPFDKVKYGETKWKLSKINGVDVFEFDTHSTLYFTISHSNIYLDLLKPTFPTISGVDFLQVVTALAYVCERELHLKDASDLSTPYLHLYEKNYYESTIKGPFPLKKNEKKIFDVDKICKCTNTQLTENDKVRTQTFLRSMNKNVKSCQKDALILQNCPVGLVSIGSFLYENIFPKCIADIVPTFDKPELEFEIKLEDLHRLMIKVPPSHLSLINPKFTENCSKIETYDNLELHLSSEIIQKSFHDAFEFCFGQIKNMQITEEYIFKNVMRCVSQNVNFLWKNTCAE